MAPSASWVVACALGVVIVCAGVGVTSPVPGPVPRPVPGLRLQLQRAVQEQLPLHARASLKSTLDRLPYRLSGPLGAMPPGQAMRTLFEIWTGKSSLRADDAALVKASVERGIWDFLILVFRFVVDFLGHALDPLWLGSYKFNISDAGVQARMSLDSVRISNLLATEVTDYGVSVTSFCAYGDVVQPLLAIAGLYDVDGSAVMEGFEMTFFGDGPVNVQVSDTKTHAALCVAFPDGDLAIEMRDLQMSVGALKVDIRNLFHDETVAELISGIASDVGPAAVKELQPELVQTIMDVVNKILKDIFPFTTIHNFTNMIDNLGY